MAAEASIAMSVKDNLSAAVVSMRNSLTNFRHDATELEKELARLSATKVALKVDMKEAADKAKAAKDAFRQLGTEGEEAAKKAEAREAWQKAEAELEAIRQRYDLVAKQARETAKAFENASGAITRVDNRARLSGGGAGSAGNSGGLLSVLGKTGLTSMMGSAVSQWANLAVSSALGSDAGGLFSGALGGAVSGAAMGSLAGPVGTAVGAALGGAVGLLSSSSQAAQARDQNFIQYYNDLYDTQRAAREAGLASGTDTAAQRENDLRTLSTLLDGDTQAAKRFQQELIEIGRTPPFSYNTVADLSKSMLGLGLSTDDVTGRIAALGEAAAALGWKESGVGSIVSYLESALLAGKLDSRVVKNLSKQGVNVYEALAGEFSIAEEEVLDKLSSLDVDRAVDAIYRYMETAFAGAADSLTQTYSGAAGIRESRTEDIESGYGEGYNALRAQGLARENEIYSGALGEAMKWQNRLSGENAAYMDNLKEDYVREALSAVLLGRDTSLFGEKDRQQLQSMGVQYASLSDHYERTGDRTDALKMEELTTQAQAVAQAAFESSNQYKQAQEAQKDSLSAIRENTSALEAATSAYNLAQERTKGAGAAAVSSVVERAESVIRSASASMRTHSSLNTRRGRSHAAGLNRVPYDDYPALLHQGERVLTASQVRVQEQNTASPVQITVSGNTFGAGLDEAAVAQAIADEISLQLQAGFRGQEG